MKPIDKTKFVPNKVLDRKRRGGFKQKDVNSIDDNLARLEKTARELRKEGASKEAQKALHNRIMKQIEKKKKIQSVLKKKNPNIIIK